MSGILARRLVITAAVACAYLCVVFSGNLAGGLSVELAPAALSTAVVSTR